MARLPVGTLVRIDKHVIIRPNGEDMLRSDQDIVGKNSMPSEIQAAVKALIEFAESEDMYSNATQLLRHYFKID